MSMKNKYYIKYKGRNYTVAGFAKAFNLTPSLLYTRLKKGKVGDALAAPKRGFIRTKPLSPELIKGRYFKALSEEHNLHINTLRSRHKKGDRGEKLVRGENSEGINELRKLSESTGIQIKTLRSRYSAGDRGERLTRPTRKNHETRRDIP